MFPIRNSMYASQNYMSIIFNIMLKIAAIGGRDAA
jgi:hypothetical protein